MIFTEYELSPTKYESNHASKLALKLRASNKSADMEKIAIYVVTRDGVQIIQTGAKMCNCKARKH